MKQVSRNIEQMLRDEIAVLRHELDALQQSSSRPLSDVQGSPAVNTEIFEFTQYVVDHAVFPVYYIRLDDARFEYVNDSACERLGYSQSELMTMRVWDIDPNYGPNAWPEFMAELSSHDSLTFETTHLTQSGECLAVEITAKIVEFDERKRFVAFARYIDEQKRLETELTQTVDKLESANLSLKFAQYAMDKAGDMIVFLDPETSKFEYVNDSFVKRTGYSKEQLLGMKLEQVNLELTVERWERFIDRVKRFGVHTFETADRDKNGKVYPVEVTAKYIKTGEKENLVAIVRDISVRKQHETELLHAKEQAEAASRAKSAFLANMSHELRTPLNAVIGYAELLLSSPETPQASLYGLDCIFRSGEHLLELIEEVLDMAKIEAGKVELELEVFNCHELLNDLKNLVALQIKQKGLTFSYQGIEAIPQFIRTDRRKLKQIILNLLSNAIKFTEKGEILVTAKIEKGQLWVAVKDSGVGIDKSEYSKVFEKFAQTKSGLDSKKGTGLGLPLSRNFARLMGGDLNFESISNVGTTFILNIDFTEESEPLESAQDKNKPGMNGRKSDVKILIVDDNQINRHLLKSLLERMGLAVAEASDGGEAIDMARSWQPQLIFMDRRMPIMEGDEATRVIKEVLPEIKIVTLSASILENREQEACLNVADAFLQKPYKSRQIIEVLESLLAIELEHLMINNK